MTATGPGAAQGVGSGTGPSSGSGADPRTQRTRARLRAALLTECETRPLEQVSLSAVARRAGVGRATLYLHYEGLHALAVDACGEVVRDGVDALHAWTGTPSPDRPPPPLVAFLEEVAHRAELHRALLTEGGGGPLGALLHTELRERSRAERVRAGAPRPDLAAAATAALFTGLLADWLHGQVALSAQEFAGQVWRLLLAVHHVVR